MHDLADLQPEQLLTYWLSESDEGRGQEALGRLIAVHAEPVVRRIVGFKLVGGSSQKKSALAVVDVDDVCNNALRNLLTHLDSLKEGAQQNPPRNFTSYVATTAFNACNEYFREKSPARYSLANRLRYLLSHSTQFALWEGADGRETAGGAGMSGQAPLAVSSTPQIVSALDQLSSNQSLVTVVREVFGHTKEPLTFEALLEIVAQATGLHEVRATTHDTDEECGVRGLERIRDSRPSVESDLASREYISRLWSEICDLPRQQSGALLLNLKDSAGGDIQLFAWLGIASIREIGQTLDMEPERFAALWKELPLDDARIAQELGIQRQDVINRRSSARKRLANRMREYLRGR
jgi:DNA-directed RNA polymerase specialized sigma24 family protein